jgi:transcriptional regulator with XRE-family HTH domain
MRNKPHHFIREWRQSRNLSLRKLADRLVTDTFDPVISYASLSRIEKGDQPYSQEVLEAIADALGTSPASLLIFDPSRDDGLLTIWDKIPVKDRAKALKVLSGFVENDGTNG